MKVKFLVLAIVVFFFLPRRISASSLVTINADGKTVFNVLASEDAQEPQIPQKESLEVKDIALNALEPDAKISLLRVDGQAKLTVASSLGEKDIDVTDYKDSLITVEQRPQVEKLSISYSGAKFILSQSDISAETEYQIGIDPKYVDITISTPTGLKYLSILPRQAADFTLSSGLISEIKDRLVISENVGGELLYKVSGNKVLNFFNVVKYPVPVNAQVSASNGKIVSIDEPVWLKFFGFLFS